MKFRCTTEASAEARQRALVEYLKNWHPHFAWLPAHMEDGTCYWLETVSRRYPDAYFGECSRKAREGDTVLYRP
jgi:hypothetical protein